MAKFINKTGKHIEIRSRVNGVVQGSSSLPPGGESSGVASGGPNRSIEYWHRGNTGTKQVIMTEDYNGVYNLF